MNTNDFEFKEMIYNLMNGFFDLEKVSWNLANEIENEFEMSGFCGEAYEKIFNANCSICERLNIEEDVDVECIINNQLVITKYLCLKMYDYGYKYALIDDNINRLVDFYKRLTDLKKEAFMKFINAIDNNLSD